MRLIIFLVPTIVLAAADGGDDNNDERPDFHHFCPTNQRWLRCGPPCGDPKCPGGGDFKCMTSQRCGQPGCYCEDGFVRDGNRNCIPKEHCQKFCRDNEEMNRCGSRCEKKCPTSPDQAENQHFCPCNGPPACSCRQEFYRASSGHCVKWDQCPHFCDRDEIFNPCGNACEKTCAQLNSGQSHFCPNICQHRGACVCRDGLYRNPHGKCVSPRQCSHCGPNEEPSDCAPPPQCQQHCQHDDNSDFCSRARLRCQPGCVCQRGFLRDRSGKCIHFRQCGGRGHD